MAFAALRLVKRLCLCLQELQRITREGNERLFEYEEFNPSQYHIASWALKESSTRLTRCLSLLDDVLLKIEALPKEEREGSDLELHAAVATVDSIEVSAQLALSVLDAKLKHMTDLWNALPASDKVIPSVCVAKSSPTSPSTKNEDVTVHTKTVNESSPPHESTTWKVKVDTKLVEQWIEEPKEDSASEDESEPVLPRVTGAPSIESREMTTDEEVPQITSQSDSNAGQVAVAKTRVIKLPYRPFNLKRIYGTQDLVKFWIEFHETVHKSPLDPVQKFAALRSMIRGEPYRSFIDLSYRTDASYEIALSRLLYKYTDQLSAIKTAEGPQRPLPWHPEEPLADIDPYRWSDEYFKNKFCRSVPNYKSPDRPLLIRAIHAFLNLYTVGPERASPRDFASVWVILLHGVRLGDRRLLEEFQFGGTEQISFPELAPSVKERMVKFAPSFIQKKDGESKKKPRFWKWTYTYTEKNTTRQEQFTTNVIKEWYDYCWTQVVSCADVDFVEWVAYFALLSMVLFRATVKNGKTVELYVVSTFNRMVSDFVSLSGIPRTVPPHSGVHTFLRTVVFKRNSSAFRTYLTYVVGCYSFTLGRHRAHVRNYLNAGCVQTLAGLGLGCVYWLRRAAQVHKMKPEDLLMFFLIDPAMQEPVKTVYRFNCTYKKEITWWWARVFENRKLKSVSNASWPAFAYACYILHSRNKDDATISDSLYQFTRFMHDDVGPELSGKNLGLALRDILYECSHMPLSDVTQSLYKKIEMKKTHLAG